MLFVVLFNNVARCSLRVAGCSLLAARCALFVAGCWVLLFIVMRCVLLVG